ncbi:MAG: type II toxin-antitoxin system RelE/ParE family toxin [Proteobacteria bacterium]|nr:type II toxin-antitoxin system RelE/ParE family toxin [Pseudomonadota bacterium]
MIFIEGTIFSQYIHEYMDDAEYAAFQWYLVLNPEAGDLIPRSGGLRKIRWAGKGNGKRGGVRVIYYFKKKDDHIWLLTIYAKNEMENISPRILKLIKEELE